MPPPWPRGFVPRGDLPWSIICPLARELTRVLLALVMMAFPRVYSRNSKSLQLFLPQSISHASCYGVIIHSPFPQIFVKHPPGMRPNAIYDLC